MNSFMDIAINEAKSGVNLKHGGPFGAVIVFDNKIIAKAHNEVIFKNDPTCHAEIIAIRRASKLLNNFNLEGCSIYTTCEPCPMCLSAILWAKIDKIFFGCTKEDAEKIGFNDSLYFDILSKNTDNYISMSKLNRFECLEVFNLWDKSDKKTNY
ncbi:MAG: nucleoside deaminase [Clostridiales bacterium]